MDFGISLDPASVTLRHCLEDSDDEEDDGKQCESVTDPFIIPDNIGVLTTGANLILTIGQPASIFAKSYLSPDSLPPYTVSTQSLTTFKDKYFSSSKEPQPSYTVSECSVLQCKDEEKFQLCTHQQQLNSQHCNPWCSKLIELLHPKLVLILTSCKAHEYLSPYTRESSSGSSHTLRALHSSTWRLQPLARNLEAPNTIIGEAAAILTHCQLDGVPTAMVVCYSESTQSTGECVSAFRPVLSHSLLQDHLIVKSDSQARQELKRLVPKSRQDLSNLYT